MTKETAWLPLASGGRFYPLAPRIEDIHIQDIAHALSQVNRYVGQTTFPYSVAQHSVYVSRMVPAHLALVGLLHDASEAYLSDISRDVKMLMPEYKEWEANLERMIAQRFDLPYPWPAEVKEADTEILRREGAWLFPEHSAMWPAWGITNRQDYLPISQLTSAQAKLLFLHRFEDLTTKRRSNGCVVTEGVSRA